MHILNNALLMEILSTDESHAYYYNKRNAQLRKCDKKNETNAQQTQKSSSPLTIELLSSTHKIHHYFVFIVGLYRWEADCISIFHRAIFFFRG
jgi:hypothetical protein